MISNVFSKLDLFSREVTIYVDSKKRIKSDIGGIFSIFFLGLILFFFYSMGKDLFLKENPKLITKEKILPQGGSWNFTADNSAIAFNLQKIGGNAINEDLHRILDITIYFNSKLLVQNNQLNYKTIFQPLNYVNCTKLKNDYIELIPGYNDLFCIDQLNHTIEGEWRHEKIGYLGFEIALCKNTTEKNDCLPEQRILDIIQPPTSFSFRLKTLLILMTMKAR